MPMTDDQHSGFSPGCQPFSLRCVITHTEGLLRSLYAKELWPEPIIRPCNVNAKRNIPCMSSTVCVGSWWDLLRYTLHKAVRQFT
jgi:hypothetical protein